MLTQRVELGCVGEYRNDGARDVIISTSSADVPSRMGGYETSRARCREEDAERRITGSDLPLGMSGTRGRDYYLLLVGWM